MTRLAFGLSALTLALLLPARAAEPPAPANPPSQSDRAPRMAKRLGLSAEQSTQLQALRTRHQEAIRPLREAVDKAQEAFHAALRQPKADNLKELHQTLVDRRWDLLTAQRTHQQEVRALLSPEQRERVAEFRGRMQGRREAMHGGREGHGRRGFRDEQGPMGGAPFGMARHERHPGGPMGAPMLRHLNLTPEQRTAMASRRQKDAEALKPLHEASRKAMKAFQEAAHRPDTPVSTLKPLHQALADQHFQLMMAQHTQRGALLDLLTPEQRKRLEEGRRPAR